VAKQVWHTVNTRLDPATAPYSVDDQISQDLVS
jgi:hypothetical protein